MTSYGTTLSVRNRTDMAAKISISEVDNYDWDGDSRPDKNFQGVTISAGDTCTQREELNASARSAWYRMTLTFTNGDTISFRNDQYDERGNYHRLYSIEGPQADKYHVIQDAGGSNNTFSIYYRRQYEQFANVVADVLNSNFFTGNDWNDMERWERSSALSTMVNYVKRTNSEDVSKWMDVVRSVSHNESLYHDNVTDGVDDALWAIISSLDAYELLKEDLLLTRTFNDFDRVAGTWDGKCDGGVYWKFDKSAGGYKNAVTNELFLHAATKLYRLTSQGSYLNWATKEYDWFAKKFGPFNDKRLIVDGMNPPGCTPGGDTWTYNQGIILGGLANLFVITGTQSYLDDAKSIVKAVLNPSNSLVNGLNRVLKEVTNNLNNDQKVFKGIFMRYLSYLLEVMPKDDPDRTAFTRFITNNADYVWNNQRDSSNMIPTLWDQPSLVLDAMTQASGLDLFTAAIVAAGIRPNDRLYGRDNHYLTAGDALVSSQQKYKLLYQGDGNLVVYRLSDGKAIWASNTDGNPAWRTYMQPDGNFVIYKSDGNSIWASNTPNHSDSVIIMQDDGNLVIYDSSGKPIWASNTAA